MALPVPDLLSLFFGDDKKGAMFVNANYPFGKFERTFDSPEKVKDIMKALMDPANYKSKTTAAFTRLIRNAAVRHSEINAPSRRHAADFPMYTGGGALKGGALPSPEKKNIFINIFSQIGDIDSFVRSFYKAYVEVKSDTRVLTDDEIASLKVDTIDTWIDNYEIAVKSGSGKNGTLFGDHIPSLPLATNNTVWEPQRDGSVKVVSDAGANWLQEFYARVYASPATQAISGLEEFDLDWPVYLRNVQAAMEKKDREDCAEEDKPTTDPCCTELPDFTDMAYGEVWKYDSAADKKEYYKMVNGERKYYSDLMKDAKHCYSGSDKNPECLNLMKCLADGNPSTLNACLDWLRNQPIWRVAKQDISNAHPELVKLILRKFNVKAREATDENGKKYKFPMTYNEWEADGLPYLPKEASAVIEASPVIKTYIKCLINFCQENPAIINKFVPKKPKYGYGTEQKSDYATRLNKQKFFDISSEAGPGPYAVLREQLMGMGFRDFMPKMLPTHMARLNNVVYMNPNAMSGVTVGGGYAQQRGGGPSFGQYSFPSHTSGSMTLRDGSSDMFTTVFKLITQGLNNMRVKVNDEDAKKIACAIDKIKELENKLLQIVKRYSIAIRMGESFCATNFVTSDSQVADIKFENITDEASARKFMEGHAKALHDAYQSLHGHYGNLCSSLATQVFPRYLDRCCEKDKAAPAKADKKYVDFSEPCN